MTAAPGPSPQQIRERLLQAVDPSSNIRNMDAVLEVISSLEKYPITKEALEETRLGKLINDVRKKTENEELAKRAKKLLRNWQKLIEPIAQNDAALRGLANAPGSANGGAHNCRTETPPGLVAGPKPPQNVKSRNDIQKLHSPKPGNRKRKGEAREHLQGGPVAGLAKISKVSCEALHNSSPPPTNGIGGSPESFPSPPDGSAVASAQDGSRAEICESDKPCKIPINAVRPHTSSPGTFKPSGPPLLKTQGLPAPHEKAEETAASQPRSPRCASFSPRHGRLETLAWQQATYSPKALTPARSPRLPPLDMPAAVPSSPPSSPLPMKKLEASLSAITGVPLQGSDRQAAPESQVRLSAGASHPTETLAAASGFSPEASAKADSDGTASGSESRKKKKHRAAADCLDGPGSEGGLKPVRLKKERRLTFDPMTGEIKPLLAQRDALPADLPTLGEQHRTGSAGAKPDPELPLPSPFEQTNWKELSRNEIIQSYLNRQSSLLSSSGVQTPGAHYFMSEYLKQEESTRREARKSHVLAPHGKPSGLPGVTREVTLEDLDRISRRHWPGVNGCYDTQGNWYDWTQCIALDPHGDDGRLNVLPYVCLD